jgi:hypothetical protein
MSSSYYTQSSGSNLNGPVPHSTYDGGDGNNYGNINNNIMNSSMSGQMNNPITPNPHTTYLPNPNTNPQQANTNFFESNIPNNSTYYPAPPVSNPPVSNPPVVAFDQSVLLEEDPNSIKLTSQHFRTNKSDSNKVSYNQWWIIFLGVVVIICIVGLFMCMSNNSKLISQSSPNAPFGSGMLSGPGMDFESQGILKDLEFL